MKTDGGTLVDKIPIRETRRGTLISLRFLAGTNPGGSQPVCLQLAQTEAAANLGPCVSGQNGNQSWRLRAQELLQDAGGALELQDA